MLTKTLITLFTKALKALKKEIETYNNEGDLWLIPDGISNSTGNLCLHLIGNLNHFIGAALGNTGYIRQRDLEFSLKDVPKTELIKQIEETIDVVSITLEGVTEDDLQKEYVHRVLKEPMTTEFFLMYLTSHLAYHLGQINYHRRLLDNLDV
jgi:hypothetical protein